MLRYLVERTLDGHGDRLKEYTVGSDAFNRGVAFDPRTDPIVRAEASRLRARLDRYYSTDGHADPVVIELPKGSYVPQFRTRIATRLVRQTRWQPILWVIAGSAATIAAFATGAWVARPAVSTGQPLLSLDVYLQSSGIVGSEVGTDFVVADDASRVVYVAAGSAGNTRLHTRSFGIDGSPAVALPGTEGARGPFLSPDGHWVGFWAGGQLKKTSLDGGSPVVLCPASDLLGASWGADGTILAAFGASGKLSRVSSAAGASTPTPVLDLSAERRSPLWPQLLPGGKRVLYTALTVAGADRANIEVASLPDGHRTVLVKGGTYGRYVAPGYLTYVNQGTLYAVRIDLDRLELRGSPVQIVNDVAYSGTFGYAQAAFAANGVLAYRREGRVVVVMRDSAGHDTPLLDAPGRYAWPALSPDGRRLSLTATESGVRSTSIFEIVNGRAKRVAAPTAEFGSATWTRDGRYLVGSDSNGLAWIGASGGTTHRLIDIKAPTAPWSFAPDGRLAYSTNSATTALDLWTAPITTTNSRASCRRASRAPADSILRGVSDLLARRPLVRLHLGRRWNVGDLRALASGGVRQNPSVARRPCAALVAGTFRKLFYATDDQRLMVAKYATRNDTFSAQPPRQWTTGRLAETGVFPNYDIAADGRRIVALMPFASGDGAPPGNHITMIFNFVEELKRRVR